MSKAFVKEDGESADDLDLEVDPLVNLPPGSKNYLTLQGYEKLRAKINAAISSRATAPSSALERKIQNLQRILERSEPVDPEAQTGDRILFGATVTVCNENGDSHQYTIVGLTEADPQRGRISWLSPVGKGLLQHRVGDVVMIKTPHGEEELEVKKVEFLPIR